MTTTTAISEKETAALRRLERAAREVVRYPDDRKPHVQLRNALHYLDAVRRQET